MAGSLRKDFECIITGYTLRDYQVCLVHCRQIHILLQVFRVFLKNLSAQCANLVEYDSMDLRKVDTQGRFSNMFYKGWVRLECNGPVNTIKDMSSRSAYLTLFFLGMLCPLSGQPVLVLILPPETGNCPSCENDKGDNSCDFLFVFLHSSLLLKRDQLT